MSKDRMFWEERFVDTFILKSKRSRYRRLLRNPRKRSKILDRLNHNVDLDFSQATELSGKQSIFSQLIRKLSALNIDEQCRLICDNSDHDGRLLPWKEGIEITANADFGTIMICPPEPIVIYRAEAPEKSLYLFSLAQVYLRAEHLLGCHAKRTRGILIYVWVSPKR